MDTISFQRRYFHGDPLSTHDSVNFRHRNNVKNATVHGRDLGHDLLPKTVVKDLHALVLAHRPAAVLVSDLSKLLLLLLWLVTLLLLQLLLKLLLLLLSLLPLSRGLSHLLLVCYRYHHYVDFAFTTITNIMTSLLLQRVLTLSLTWWWSSSLTDPPPSWSGCRLHYIIIIITVVNIIDNDDNCWRRLWFLLRLQLLFPLSQLTIDFITVLLLFLFLLSWRRIPMRSSLRPYPEYSRAKSYLWSPPPPKRARPGPGPHTPRSLSCHHPDFESAAFAFFTIRICQA